MPPSLRAAIARLAANLSLEAALAVFSFAPAPVREPLPDSRPGGVGVHRDARRQAAVAGGKFIRRIVLIPSEADPRSTQRPWPAWHGQSLRRTRRRRPSRRARPSRMARAFVRSRGSYSALKPDDGVRQQYQHRLFGHEDASARSPGLCVYMATGDGLTIELDAISPARLPARNFLTSLSRSTAECSFGAGPSTCPAVIRRKVGDPRSCETLAGRDIRNA